MKIKISFLGGAGTVTGSKYLIEAKDTKILIDCGLFQGLKELRLKNREPIDPRLLESDAIILTHAHLDHTGFLPVLGKNGYKNPIYSSEPTYDLTKIILLDSATIQKEDADHANQFSYTKHEKALPLYTEKDVKKIMQNFKVCPTHTWIKIKPKVKFKLIPSGHILGSTFIKLDLYGYKIVFSGDLGRQNPLILYPPETIQSADILFIESTYGDRLHPKDPPINTLEKIILDTLEKKGTLLIPSFTVGRAQDILYCIYQLKKLKRIPNIPVYLDSPMALQVSELYLKHLSWHKLREKTLNEIFNFSGLRMVTSQIESYKIQSLKTPAIIIAGSGMLTGGRILHHLKNRISDSKNTILFTGFQATGTRGRLVLDGAHEIKFFGQYYPIKSQIECIASLSAHADQSEILKWLKNFKKPPVLTFIVHGEPQSSESLRVKIQTELKWENCIVEKLNDEVVIEFTKKLA
jgi:metallo-beta-lactamase family protein